MGNGEASILTVMNSSDELRIAIIADEGPALFFCDAAFGVGVCGIDGFAVAALDEGFGVFEVAVDGLDGRVDAVFLFLQYLVSFVFTRKNLT